MQFTDAVTVAGTRRRDDGCLVADARVARTGIQIYAGWEVGKSDKPPVRVYRSEAVVLSGDTPASFLTCLSLSIIPTNWSPSTTGKTLP